MAEASSSSDMAAASSAAAVSSGISSLPAAVLSRIALAAGDFLSKDFAGRGSTGFAATCHTLLESHLDAHPRTHSFALRYIPCGAPAHPRGSLGGHPLQWSGLKVGPRDSVIIGDEKAAQISSPGQLLRILSHPGTRFEELVARAGSVTLYVDCRTLLACRDKALDGDTAALLAQLRRERDDAGAAMSEFRKATLEEMEEDEARAAKQKRKEEEKAAAAAAAGAAPAADAASAGAAASVPTSASATAAMSTDGEVVAASHDVVNESEPQGAAAAVLPQPGATPAMETDGSAAQPSAAAQAGASDARAEVAGSAPSEVAAGSTGSVEAGAGAGAAAASAEAESASAPQSAASASPAPAPVFKNPFAEPISVAISQAAPAAWMHEPLKGRDAVDAAGAAELRRLLQLCGSKQRDGRGGLRVDFSSTDVGGWNYVEYSAWAGVLRSFPGISEMILRDGKAAWLESLLERGEQLFPVRSSLRYTLRLLDSSPTPFDGRFGDATRGTLSTKWTRGHFYFKGDLQVRRCCTAICCASE